MYVFKYAQSNIAAAMLQTHTRTGSFYNTAIGGQTCIMQVSTHSRYSKTEIQPDYSHRYNAPVEQRARVAAQAILYIYFCSN